jgi:alkanesulfonate monooxygenase SsuD/methylene tetrahydromethanopterin reductase-like flavin-dependent oxidoreductase (luciferase family)
LVSTYPGKEQPYPPQMTRYLDPVLLWTVAATATSRVRLNASTLSTFYYEPAHLARLLTTLDVLSDGRLEVGVGLGRMKAAAPAGSGSRGCRTRSPTACGRSRAVRRRTPAAILTR